MRCIAEGKRPVMQMPNVWIILLGIAASVRVGIMGMERSVLVKVSAGVGKEGNSRIVSISKKSKKIDF